MKLSPNQGDERSGVPGAAGAGSLLERFATQPSKMGLWHDFWPQSHFAFSFMSVFRITTLEFYIRLVGVAPHPVLVGIDRLDDRVAS